MNVYLTGIVPMMPCVKGAADLAEFSLERLYDPISPDWFDVKAELGERGFKYFNPATRYMLAAVRKLDDVSDESVTDGGGKGVIIGSTSCTRHELEEIDSALLSGGYSSIHPMRAPSFCPNLGAGTISIKHRAKALNITLVNPMTAGLEAIVAAKRAIVDGRAASVITGAMEDDSEFTLGQKYTVTTSGGAWAFRLEGESDDPPHGSSRPAVARIGATLNCFVPVLDIHDSLTVDQVLHDLHVKLDPLLSGAEVPDVAVSMLTDSHSLFVFGLLKKVFAKYQVQASQMAAPHRDTAQGTLMAMAQLSWLGLNSQRAVSVAISPLGHLTAVEILKPNT